MSHRSLGSGEPLPLAVQAPGTTGRSRRRLVAEEVRAEAMGPVEDGHRRRWAVEGVAVEIAIGPLAESAA